MPKKFGRDRIYVIAHSTRGYVSGAEILYHEGLAQKRVEELLASDHYNPEIDDIKMFSVLPGASSIHLLKDEDGCPMGGDERNNCEGCVYSSDYHFNKETKECVPR